MPEDTEFAYVSFKEDVETFLDLKKIAFPKVGWVCAVKEENRRYIFYGTKGWIKFNYKALSGWGGYSFDKFENEE